MQIHVLLNITQIFPNEKRDISSLLKGIPSKNIISILCAINSWINQGQNDLKHQLDLLELFLNRQPNEVSKEIIENIQKEIKTSYKEDKLGTTHLIFANWPILKFIEFEISQNREPNKPLEEISPKCELLILKAIFIFNKFFDEKLQSLVVKPTIENDFFYSIAWPVIFFQHSLTIKSNYFYEFTKSLILFVEISKTKYKDLIQSFVHEANKPDIQSYLFQILETANFLNKEPKEGMFSNAGISLKNNENLRTILEINTLELSGKSIPEKVSHNFNLLRSKPFFKLNDDIYLIFHKDFISRKLYDGLIFDFIEHSKKVNNQINLPNFKSKFSDSILEKKIFQNIIKRAFERKINTVYFGKNDGETDAYFIIRNTLFILEFKDCYFSSETIENPTKEKILAEITNKICSSKSINADKNKGVGQLINAISNLDSLQWMKGQKYKASKLKIQPIIIVTDSFFALHGVNKYCSKVFQNHAEILLKEHKNIEKLLILDFEFLFFQFPSFKNKKLDFKDLIQNYFSYINKIEKKLSKQKGQLKDVENSFLGFQEYISKRIIYHRNPEFVNELFEMFDFTSGLPIE